MGKEQIIELATYLRELSTKLDDDTINFTEYVIGALVGIAEGLEILAKNKYPNDIKTTKGE